MYKNLKNVIKFYDIKEFDLLNYKVTKDNYLTYHHIHMRKDGGRHSVKNGIPLTLMGHNYLHQIEKYDYEKYLLLNDFFNELSKRHGFLTDEETEYIESILLAFERDNADKINEHNCKLIINEDLLLKLMDDGVVSFKISKDNPTHLRVIMQMGYDFKIPKEKHIKKKLNTPIYKKKK